MNACTAIQQIIENMPNFFGLTRKATIGAEGDTETRVYTQDDIAGHVAARLISRIHTKGCLVVELPPVETDEYGSQTVRIPITGQAWAYGEVRISDQGDGLIIVDIPSRLPLDDAPAFAAALLATHNAARPRR